MTEHIICWVIKNHGNFRQYASTFCYLKGKSATLFTILCHHCTRQLSEAQIPSSFFKMAARQPQLAIMHLGRERKSIELVLFWTIKYPLRGS